MSDTTDRVLYTREEAAAALNIGITKMKQLIASGEISSIKIGRLRRITVTSVREYVELQKLREREANA